MSVADLHLRTNCTSLTSKIGNFYADGESTVTTDMTSNQPKAQDNVPGQPGQDRRDGTTVTGNPLQDIQKRNDMTGQQEQP